MLRHLVQALIVMWLLHTLAGCFAAVVLPALRSTPAPSPMIETAR